MPAVSGLDVEQRAAARQAAVRAALMGLDNISQVHYTQDSRRWDGISNKRVAAKGKVPHHSDCSSFATWCLWNGLNLGFEVGDVVNGLDWTAGYTGTMLQNGKEVRRVEKVRQGDCVIYGSESPGTHVAIVVGRQDGVPMVVSHGSEEGPFFVRYNYRSDVLQFRRYI
jgi:cell wall-associated NlpC family hydrolase